MLRRGTSLCERTIKTISLACLQAQQLQRNHCRAHPRLNCKLPLRDTLWLHSTAVFAARDFRHDPPISLCPAITFEAVDDTPAPSATTTVVVVIATFRIIITCLCLRPGNTRDTCARCAQNTCDLLPTVYLLAPIVDGEIYMYISYTSKGPLSLEANKISTR